jgi:ABC-type antimicrobial peptide transport system permease subunit
MTTRERLAAFHEVENTYISIFHLLGGLGVLLGSAGLGVATARNLAERRHEFSMMRTIGVPTKATKRVIAHETWQLIRAGLGIGVAAALVSIAPNLPGTGLAKPLGWIGLWLAMIAVNAWFWAWLGARRQLRDLPHPADDAG